MLMRLCQNRSFDQILPDQLAAAIDVLKTCPLEGHQFEPEYPDILLQAKVPIAELLDTTPRIFLPNLLFLTASGSCATITRWKEVPATVLIRL